ncbi:aminotransferase class I/II-fold pyridoxal phosphate-dependent enzyme [Oerskovia sp. M15]
MAPALDHGVRGAKEVAVELYSMTKSYSMAGWRVAFLVGARTWSARSRSSSRTWTTGRSSPSRSRRP